MGIYKQLEIDYEIDVVDDFLEHLLISCDALERLIISLNNKDRYKSNINEIFRIFHNTKSAAGFLKIGEIVSVCSVCEDVLEEARELDGPASEEFIDWLLLISDQLLRYKSDLELDAPYFSVLNLNISKIPLELNK